MIETILAEGAKALGISLNGGALNKYREYYDELTRANRDFNLTAIEGEDQAARLHFLDSAALLTAADLKNARLADVGTGGGLPGLAVKIAEPSIDLTLIDATEKKIDFLKRLTEKLSIDASCICGRAEELAKTDLRESFDAVTSRAVARLNVLCELCLPLVRVGGLFLAMKGSGAAEEISEAENAITTLGGTLRESREYTIPGTDIRRYIAVIEKTSPTPEKYPRRWAAINKRPL